MAVVSKPVTSKCGRGEPGTPRARCQRGLVQLVWAVWRLREKFNTGLPFGPAVPLLGTHPGRTETLTCVPTVVAFLCARAKMDTQPGCPLMGEGRQDDGVRCAVQGTRP